MHVLYHGEAALTKDNPDLHEYLGGAKIMPTTPHPITNEKVPLTLGHEFSGVVEEVGEGVYDIKVGAKVTIQPIIYDGTCGACREGYINCCDNNGFVGLSGELADSPVSDSTLTTPQGGAVDSPSTWSSLEKPFTRFLTKFPSRSLVSSSSTCVVSADVRAQHWWSHWL